MSLTDSELRHNPVAENAAAAALRTAANAAAAAAECDDPRILQTVYTAGCRRLRQLECTASASHESRWHMYTGAQDTA